MNIEFEKGLTFKEYRNLVEKELRNLDIYNSIKFIGFDTDDVLHHAVRELIPYSEIIDSTYTKLYDTPGITWEKPPRESEFLIFIPNVNTYSLALKAIESLGIYGGSSVIINQESSVTWPTKCSVANAKNVSFTQIQNWIQKQAIRYGLKYFYFMHSDAEVTDNTFYRLRQFFSENPNWDIVQTSYDALIAFKVESLFKLGVWDETFDWYVSDIDFYNRAKWSGCNVLVCRDSEVIHNNPSSTLRNSSTDFSNKVNCDHTHAISHYAHKWGYNFQSAVGTPYKTPYGVQG